ncbi:epidermal growth factor receptor kinase substrate 8-like protein 3b [Rhinoraja longicauda]
MYGGFGQQHIPAYDEIHSRATLGNAPEKPLFTGTQSTATRPSAKTIYQQRKAYTQKLNSQDNLIQHRVEHLITCDHKQNERMTVEHCIQQLKKLDAVGRVWGQGMFLQVDNTSFKMVDIETKDNLDNFPIDMIQDSQAILDSCLYNSILAVTISSKQEMKSSIFLFQCDEVSADIIQHDMEKIIRKKKESGIPDIFRSLPGQQISKLPQALYERSLVPSPVPKRSPLPDYDYNVETTRSEPENWTEQTSRASSDTDSIYSHDLTALNTLRNKEILNHLIDEFEFFLEKLQEAIRSNSQLKKSKSKKIKDLLPPETEYTECLQKIKYAFNVLATLESQLDQPSAADITHNIFLNLQFMLDHTPNKHLARDVVVPLLTQDAIEFLTSNTSKEERKTWKSLGNAWLIERSRWPNGEDLEAYNPTFSDGWVLPPLLSQQRLPPRPSPLLSNEGDHPAKQVPDGTRQDRDRAERSQRFAKVIYDFKKRNTHELTVTAGDVLEVMESSKQWWKVRDRNGDVGHVPQNILQFMDQDEPASSHPDYTRGFQHLPKAPPARLTNHCTPSEVSAWLQGKGFSNMTVKSLGVHSGSQLLSLSEQELRMVNASEGHIVYNEIHGSDPIDHQRPRKITQRDY